jgi:hypothetical protein
MGKSLVAVLSREGYSDAFRSEILAMTPGERTDLVFSAGFMLITEPSYNPHTRSALLLDTIELLKGLLPHVSDDAVSNKLQFCFAGNAISKGSAGKRLKAASLLVSMCNRLGRRHEEEISQLRCEISHMTGAAAEAFVRAMDQRRIIDIEPDQPGRKVA